MLCMKCGREIDAEQVFCPGCLAEMEKYPVKPGTVVTIPQRPAQSPAKKQSGRRHPSVPLEEQVKRLKKRLAITAAALVAALAVAIGLGALLVSGYLDDADKLLPGQNYSSAASTQPGTSD